MESERKTSQPWKPRHAKGGNSRSLNSMMEPEEWQPRFLEAFARCGMVRHAAKEVKVSYQTVYNHLKKDEAFAENFQLTILDAQELVELEMRRRAMDGVEVPIMRKVKGEYVEVGRYRKYSDKLLCFLLKLRRPEVFGSVWEIGGRTKAEVSPPPPKIHLLKDEFDQQMRAAGKLDGGRLRAEG